MKESKTRKQHPYGFLFRFLVKTFLLTAAVASLCTWILCFHRMTGNRMFPAVRDGDLCVFYRLESCGLGDVVLYEDGKGTLRVGRIAAVGGQTVDFPETGGYEVDGYQPLEEIPYETYAAEESIGYPIVLGEDEIFLLNDFRSDTSDSREVGPVKASRIKGKLLVLLRRRGF